MLLGEGGGVARGLAERLRSRGVRVVRAEAGERFAEVGNDQYTIRPTEREDYIALLEAVRERGDTVGANRAVWLVEPAGAWRARGLEGVGHARTRVPLACRAGAGAWRATCGAAAHSDRNERTADVASGEALCAEKAVALGPCLVVPQEYAYIRCRNVNVEPRAVEMLTETFLEQLEKELARETNETVVALRGSDWWVQEVAAVRLLGGTATGLREGGVYLITGGLGGIGLAMAEYLYRTVRARLVLVGRTGRNGDKVEGLQREGAEVLVRTADVGDRAQMEAVLEEAEARFGEVHAVIHAAGVPASGLIQRKTREMAEAVMRPKLDGVLALAEALRGRRLDFLCLFSSMSSMTGGGPGQVDYCAGNAFMDAFARQHFAEHGMTFSVSWGEWQWNAWEEGLSGFPEEARQYFIEKRRAFGLSFADGTEAFARILRHRIPNTFVATQDFAQMVEGSKNFSIITILQAVKQMRGTRPTYPRPALVCHTWRRQAMPSDGSPGSWSDVLGFSEVGAHDNFFDLGGNSLLGADLIARIRNEFQLPTIPGHLLYQAPTIATMSEELGLTEPRQVAAEDRNERNQKRLERLRNMRHRA